MANGYNNMQTYRGMLLDAILPPQGHWIEDSKKIVPKMQEKALGFS